MTGRSKLASYLEQVLDDDAIMIGWRSFMKKVERLKKFGGLDFLNLQKNDVLL